MITKLQNKDNNLFEKKRRKRLKHKKPLKDLVEHKISEYNRKE